MKAIVQVFFLLLPLIGFTQEQSNYPQEVYADFYKFEIKGDNIIALGSCKQVWTSKDLGKTWDVKEVPESMYDLAFLPGSDSQAIISAFRQVWLFDFDQGIITDFTSDLNAIGFSNASVIEVTDSEILLLSSDGIIRSEVGVYEWDFGYRDTIPGEIPNSAATTESYVYYGMRKGRILRYNKLDGTVVQVQDIGESVRGFAMVNDQLGYLAKSGTGGVLKTLDGWQTYTLLEEMPEGINPVAYGEDILLTVNTNRLYRSTDGGQSSTYIDTDIGVEYSLMNDVKFTDDGTLYGVGYGSMFVKSTDFGETFEHVNPIDRNNFYDGSISDNGVGYMVGENNIIVKTEDNGISWTKMNNPDSGTEHYLGSVEIMNDGKVFIAGSQYYQLLDGDQEVYRTEENLQAVLYNREKNYLIALVRRGSGDYVLQKSSDQGRTWAIVHSLAEDAYFSSQSPTGRIFFPINDGHVMISDDDGETWSDVEFSTITIREIQFINESIGLMVVNASLQKTIDGGDNWTEISSGYAIRGLTMVSEDQYLYSPRNENQTRLMETLDGGETFKQIFQHCSASNKMMTNSKNQVIIGQQFGHINTVDLSIPVSTSKTVIKEPSLVFPNPVQAGMNIQIDENWETLEVFNLQGQRILSAPTYRSEVSTSGMHAGVYFIKAKVGDIAKVSKFVVLD